MDQAIVPAGPHLSQWWEWCVQQAKSTYRVFIKTKIQGREAIFPTTRMPTVWGQIDSWMRPKLLEASPKDIKEWVNMRARQGKVDESHVIVFYLMKAFAPGSPEEKVQLNNSVLNPHVCSQPRAAQIELLKWKENIRRCAELGSSPPDLMLAYRAM